MNELYDFVATGKEPSVTRSDLFLLAVVADKVIKAKGQPVKVTDLSPVTKTTERSVFAKLKSLAERLFFTMKSEENGITFTINESRYEEENVPVTEDALAKFFESPYGQNPELPREGVVIDVSPGTKEKGVVEGLIVNNQIVRRVELRRYYDHFGFNVRMPS